MEQSRLEAKHNKKEYTMSRKIYAAVLPLLAVVAFAAMPATSQAAFHWYKCEKVEAGKGKFSTNACTAEGEKKEFELKQLPFTSEKLQVDTWGTLTITSVALKVKITCNVIDAGKIWNEVLANPGKDEITAFSNIECKTEEGTCATPEVQTVQASLPWPTELTATGADKIGTAAKPIMVKLFCGGAEAVALEGELTPTLTNPTTSSPLLATFTSTTGELHNAAGTVKATVTGSDNVVGFPKGEGIFVKNP